MSFIYTPPDTPAGPVNGVQYSNGNSFAAEAAFSYDPTLDKLTFGDFLGNNLVTVFMSKAPVGAQSSRFHILGQAQSSAGVTSPMKLVAGDNSVGSGGSVTIQSGTAALTNGGSIALSVGSGPVNCGALRCQLNTQSGATTNGQFFIEEPQTGTAAFQAGFLVGTNATPGIRAFGGVGAALVAQPVVGGAQAVFVVGAGVAVQDISTFDGYTIAGVVKALRNLGWLN